MEPCSPTRCWLSATAASLGSSPACYISRSIRFVMWPSVFRNESHNQDGAMACVCCVRCMDVVDSG